MAGFRLERVVGVDPSPFLVERARDLASGLVNLRFEQADGRDLPYDASSFDLVVFHTTLCHIPGPEAALAEAHRVLRPGGWLAIFDGDYATSTVAAGRQRPAADMCPRTLATLVHDRWLVRRIRSLVASSRVLDADLRSHGYVVDRRPPILLACIHSAPTTGRSRHHHGRHGPGPRRGGRHASTAGTFFGHIALRQPARPHTPPVRRAHVSRPGRTDAGPSAFDRKAIRTDRSVS